MPRIQDKSRPHTPPSQPTEAERAAREAITGMRLFPDLTVALRKVLNCGPHVEMLQHFTYWFHPRHPKMKNRWTMYKTFNEWRDECGLSERQVYKGRKKLRELGLVSEKRGPHGRIHCRVHWLALAEALSFDTIGVETDADDGTVFDPEDDASFDTVGVGPNTEEYAGDYQQESSLSQSGAEPAKAEPAPHARDSKNGQEHEARAGGEHRHSANRQSRSATAASRESRPEDSAPPEPPAGSEPLLAEVRELLDPESGRWWLASTVARQIERYTPEPVVEAISADPELPERVREANVAELLPVVAYALWERREAKPAAGLA